jgi:O-antigen ligase
MWLRARQKVLFTIMALIMGGVMFSVTSDKWTERISTVKDYQSESSAAARLAVWKWTWSFAQSNPFGGGFLAYIGNQIVLPTEEGQPPEVQNSRAYHNMFFSVLGDHGYPGIALYVGVLVSALMAFRKARKLTAKLEEHVWCADLAQAGQVALVTMMAGGMFVEIDWTPLVWYIVSLSVCLQQYAIRVAVPARSYLNLPTTSSLDPLRMPIPVSGPIPGSVKVPPLAARRGSAPVMRRTSL